MTSWTSSAGSIDESKLRPPVERLEWIGRADLLARLAAALSLPVTLIAGPAGYGKTTLVSQWLAAEQHRATTVWLTLDDADNDPTRLWTHLAVALERIDCWGDGSAAEFVVGAASAVGTRVVPRVLESLAAAPDPVFVVLDDFQSIRSAECVVQLDQLIENLPENAHLLLLTRADPALRLGRLRVNGRLAELRSRDLAFTVEEVAAVLRMAGIQLSDQAVQELHRRTEGWPAAVYLSSLTLAGHDRPEDFIDDLSGNNRFIADYLSEEVLNRFDHDTRGFILDMSVFERFSAAMSDEVTGRHSSAKPIRELERTNLFLIPLDGSGTWFRFHHLFGTFARAALEAEDPDRVALLHARGAEWLAANGRTEEAIRHFFTIGDLPQAAALVQSNWVRYFDAGRIVTIRSWLEAFKGTETDQAAPIAVTAAWLAALTGRQPELQERLSQLETIRHMGRLPDGTSSPQSALVLIRGLFGFDGPSLMLREARRAVGLETDPTTQWFATGQAALGHGAYVVGDLPRAVSALTKAAFAERASSAIRVLAFGILSLCERERGNLGASLDLAESALRVVDDAGMRGRPQSSMAFTALGAARADQTRPVEALALLEDGLRARRQVPDLSPWPLIHHLLVMAPVVAQVGQHARAEQLLTEAAGLLSWSDDLLAAMRSRLARLRIQLSNAEHSRPSDDGETLTRREVEVLRRLGGTESLREIAAGLSVSRNTVKTLTAGVYRKLGVHSRSQAVGVARSRSLI